MKIIQSNSGIKQVFDTDTQSVEVYTESIIDLTFLHHTYYVTDFDFLNNSFLKTIGSFLNLVILSVTFFIDFKY